MKDCINCKENKDLIKFSKWKFNFDGYNDVCKDCQKRTKNEKHKKRLAIWESNFVLSTMEKKQKQDNKTHRKELLNIGLKICSKCKKSKQFSYFVKISKGRVGSVCKECHSAHQSEYMKKRKETDIPFKLKCSLRSRISNVMNFYVKRGISEPKRGSAVKDLGCSIEYFCNYIESLFQPGMTWDNYGNKDGQWSLDHIFPLSKMNLTNRDEFLKANNYTNIRPLWHKENLKKSNKINLSPILLY